MPIGVRITCEQDRPSRDVICDDLQGSIASWDEAPAWAAEVVAYNCWTEVDGKYFCPGHNPADRGRAVEVGNDYVELAPGVKVRSPGAGVSVVLEVRLDADREREG